ncbi:cyclic nucleotide-binding domain-containing protein [Listeria ilorinensis]|uniref:cyclic nucleotide-binding domain-containing protein n=1 Tax=Listeria ilorinensis TaxID=2867439 RepID=UPI001EF62065|nr:cyclic nucleotide-binding domain-containing protein [Listeria ilorinensis]
MNDIQALYDFRNVHVEFQPANLFNTGMKELQVKTKILPKGSTIIKEEIHYQHIYYIKKGIISVEKQGDIYTFLPNENFVGLNGLMNHQKPFFSFIAFTETEVVIFERTEVENYIKKMQEGWLFLYVQEQRFRDNIHECYIFRREKGIRKVEKAIAFIDKIFPAHPNKPLPPEILYKEFSRFVGIKENNIQKILKKLYK